LVSFLFNFNLTFPIVIALLKKERENLKRERELKEGIDINYHF